MLLKTIDQLLPSGYKKHEKNKKDIYNHHKNHL